MTQQTQSANWPIDDTTTTGSELATYLNDLYASLMTLQAGTAQPSYIEAGMMWLKSVSGDYELYLYDGTQDNLIGTFDVSEGEWLMGGGAVTVSATAPASPMTGQIFLDTDDNSLQIYNGSSWDTVNGSTTTGADINTQSGTTYTIVAGDADKQIMLTNTGAKTITIPATLDTAFQVGIWNVGGSTVAINIDAGDTINGGSAGTGLTDCVAQHNGLYLVQRAPNTWLAGGAT